MQNNVKLIPRLEEATDSESERISVSTWVCLFSELKSCSPTSLGCRTRRPNVFSQIQKFPRTKEAKDSQPEWIFVIIIVSFSTTKISVRQLALEAGVGGNSTRVLTLQFSLYFDSSSEELCLGKNTMCVSWKSLPALNLNCRLRYLYFTISFAYCSICIHVTEQQHTTLNPWPVWASWGVVSTR